MSSVVSKIPSRSDQRGRRWRVPLSMKISLWLGLNLVLIAVIFLAVLFGRGGVRNWLRDPIESRMQLVAFRIESDLLDGEAISSVLERYSETYDLDIVIFENNGEQLGGKEIAVPAIVAERLSQRRPGGPPRDRPPPGGGDPNREFPPPGPRGPGGPGNGGPGPESEFGERGPPRPPPPTRSESRQANSGPRPGGPAQSSVTGRIFEFDSDSRRWWMGSRMPVPTNDGGQPRPGTLFAISNSAWSFGLLLDLRPFVWVFLVVVGLSIVFWIPLVAGITRALRQAVAATGEIAQGKFTVRVNTGRRDELGALGESINRMAGRLDSLVNGQKKFLADIAHELGSPIGRMQMGSAILEERVPEELRPAVRDVQEEIQQMSDLLGELLAFTKAGLQARESSIQPVVLRDAVNEAVRREAGAAPIEVDIDPDTLVGGDANLMVKVISNLLRNALRHAGETAKIEIAARTLANHRVEVEISDDGPGVPTEALERLGEPFYRPDAARSRELGGTGLGLSIVRESIEAMGGTVTFANREPRGFSVQLLMDSASL